MSLKRLLIILVVLTSFGCKKSEDPNPSTFLLTKVEYYNYPDSLMSNPRFADTVRANYYEEYEYDSNSQILAQKRYIRGNRLIQTFKTERDNDGRIGKINYSVELADNKQYEYVESFTWAADSIVSKRIYQSGLVINLVTELNANKLLINRRAYGMAFTYPKMGITYDANRNVSALTGNVSPKGSFDYDLSVFNPYACTNDIHLFNGLSYSGLGSVLPFLTMSRNWIAKWSAGPVDKVVKTNLFGYPTEVKGTNYTIRYKYNQ